MTQPVRYHIFQAYGVELEYMIVDCETLNIRPIADELLKHELGHLGSDFENDIITWSNELVMHVIELKSTKPESNFSLLQNGFADNVARVNGVLKKWNAVLMPTAAHPWMNPLTETKLWPHDSNEVYDVYNRIFDCKGHGWSNLQSTHLNLPFYDDEEFARLHAAVRMILPLLPALCASSPILDGKVTGYKDTRLNFYKTNQAKIPSITGKVVPEAVFSKRQYLNTIYEKIKNDIAPFDPDNILNPIWVNSRGAIPRFDRGSIEIRVMDVQECPAADLAIQILVIETIKAIVNESFCNIEEQMRLKTEILAGVLDETALHGQSAEILSSEVPGAFGFSAPCNAQQLWQHILNQLLEKEDTPLRNWEPEIATILREGTLSDRIVRSMNRDFSQPSIINTYQKLIDCLAQNKMFQG
ncbi:MAG TPA: glutamate-cysteine ligase family protein [Cyclobacteriaceae bacterium]|nr:glutamate-cysteine ligase family protein [Cyclobacteriaceae bacterium]